MTVPVTVVTPSIPNRAGLLRQACASVALQTAPPESHLVQIDYVGVGAARARNRLLRAVDTPWTSLLDDDDLLLPDHLRLLVQHQQDTGADVIYPALEVLGGIDPLQMNGKPFDEAKMRAGFNFVPVTLLCRTELLLDVGGFPIPAPGDACEDHACWIKLLDAGAKFSHLPVVTWQWRHWGSGNLSGRPWREVEAERGQPLPVA